MRHSSEDATTKRTILCNRCGNKTNHILMAEHHRDYPNENPDGSLGFVERLGHRFWVCAGCDMGTLEEFYRFDVTSDGYITMVDVEYFPLRTVLHVKDKKFKQLSDKLTVIYGETIRAYNTSLNVLCALGIRALLCHVPGIWYQFNPR